MILRKLCILLFIFAVTLHSGVIASDNDFEEYFFSSLGLSSDLLESWQIVEPVLAKLNTVPVLSKIIQANDDLSIWLYYNGEIKPEYHNSFLYDIVMQNSDELCEIFYSHSDLHCDFFEFVTSDFFENQADTTNPVYFDESIGQQFRSLFDQIGQYASPCLNRDLDILREWTRKFEGETLKSSFAYLINEKINMVYPVGGETIFAGTRQIIQWENTEFDDPVDILFSDGSSWSPVTSSSIANTGEYEWQVPSLSVQKDSCRILVEEAMLGKPKDKSKYFTIIPLPQDTTVHAMHFIDSTLSLSSYLVSPQLSIEPRNVSYELLPNLGDDVTLTLSSSSSTGEFSLQQYPFTPVSHVVLKSGRSRASFYYRNSKAGNDTIIVAAPQGYSWFDAVLPVNIIDGLIVEAEDMQLTGVRPIEMTTASGNSAGLPNVPYGSLTYEFFGNEGLYEIWVNYFDEDDGASEGHVKVIDRVNTAEWMFDNIASGDGYQWLEEHVLTVNLIPEDELLFRIFPDAAESGLIDYVKFVAIPDTIPPACAVQVSRPNAIDVEFSEPVVNWLDVSSYSLSSDLGTFEIEQITKQRVRLIFEHAQQPNVSYQLSIQNICDYNSNSLLEEDYTFIGFNTSIVYRVEAEKISNLSSMGPVELQDASNDSVIQFYPWISEGAYGNISFPFTFPSSQYKTYVSFYDEASGEGEGQISCTTSGTINGWDWDASMDSWQLMSWGSNNPCQIDSGATINMRVWKDGDEMGIVDYIEFRDLVSDTIPPLAHLRLSSACRLDITFSEDVTGYLTNANYSISPSLGALTITQTAPNCVKLTSWDLQTAGEDYVLTISNIEDLSGNALAPDTLQFTGYASNESDVYRQEVESISSLSNFEVVTWQGCSNGQVVQIPSSASSGTKGTATFVFNYPSGLYRAKIAFYDETAGESVGRISTSECGLINSWDWDNTSADAWFIMNWGGNNPCYISNGDTVTLEITKDGSELGVVDYIEFAPESLNKDLAEDIEIPTSYDLYPNFPNPFNPVTQIVYDLPKDVRATVKIYNIRGQVVATLVDELKEAGKHQTSWEGAQYSSGVYFYELRAGDYRKVRKMMLIK